MYNNHSLHKLTSEIFFFLKNLEFDSKKTAERDHPYALWCVPQYVPQQFSNRKMLGSQILFKTAQHRYST